jgi:hypothetical protein
MAFNIMDKRGDDPHKLQIVVRAAANTGYSCTYYPPPLPPLTPPPPPLPPLPMSGLFPCRMLPTPAAPFSCPTDHRILSIIHTHAPPPPPRRSSFVPS